jgi:hypothetical protein
MASQLKRILKRIISPDADDSDGALKYSYKKHFFRCAFKTLSYNGIDGDYAEFGCHGAMTFGLAFDEISRRQLAARLWAFDSFKGLPKPKGPKDNHPRWLEGDMAISLEEFHAICSRHGIPRSKYETVAGYYQDTLPPLENRPPANICLAYIDCDMYSSTKAVLEFLVPRLKHGMIIAFDDYYWWSSNQLAGERKAMLEFFGKNQHWHLEPYIQYGWASMSFVVEDRKLLDV